jgi:hypothetical protein
MSDDGFARVYDFKMNSFIFIILLCQLLMAWQTWPLSPRCRSGLFVALFAESKGIFIIF